MTGSKLPPQAYTRDILAHAYEWLKNQPGSVRELASSADNLVALYLQSKRRIKDGVQSYDLNPQIAKKSKAQFKSELKNLSEGLKQFEDETDEIPAPHYGQNLKPAFQNEHLPANDALRTELNTAASKTYNLGSTTSQQLQEPANPFTHNKASQGQPVNVLRPENSGPQQTLHPRSQEQATAQSPATFQAGDTTQTEGSHTGASASSQHLSGIPLDLDAKTQAYLTDVKNRLNLSSENEALRVLAAIGYDRICQILPK